MGLAFGRKKGVKQTDVGMNADGWDSHFQYFFRKRDCLSKRQRWLEQSGTARTHDLHSQNASGTCAYIEEQLYLSTLEDEMSEKNH